MMRPGRIVALVIGCLLVLPGLALLLGGGALGVAYLVERDDDGYFDVTLDRIETDTVAVTTRDVGFASDPGSPDWLLDRLDVDVRIRATPASSERAVFVGIAPEADVAAYLAGTAYDEVVDVTDGRRPVYRSRSGNDSVEPPTEQDFWVASASGTGRQELEWEATGGDWAAVLMNANGAPGVVADVNVGARSDLVLPLVWVLLGVGALVTAAAVTLIVVGATGAERPPAEAGVPGVAPVLPSVASPESSPVVLEARLDPDLSRWMWLVKWFLAIPHWIVLAFLWLAFVILTFVAGIAILFTGRYPRGIFDFNVGVLRWSWRVNYYAATGGIGTDRYPPFSLSAQPEDPARLDVIYPERLSRWLWLVKWFLAIPHLIIVALLVGGSVRWLSTGNDRLVFDPTGGGGLLGLLVLAAGVVLLFSGRYPAALFELIVGFNRWVYRVVAYVGLMTDRYPPFRLDQGGAEPHAELPPPVV